METKKWLARGGSLLVLLGFFLPSVLVSCSVTGGSSISQAYSLAKLANDPTIGQGFLYLVPFLMVAAIAASFFQQAYHQQNQVLLWSQVGCLVGSLFFTLIAAISLNNQINNLYGLGGQYSSQMKSLFQVNPDYGALVILIGYILAGIGLGGQFARVSLGTPELSWPPPPPPVQPAGPYAPPLKPYGYPDFESPPVATRPRLELIRGETPQAFFLEGDNLTIGRGSACSIRLSNSSVSRQHARLRFAQGSWFIQDQESSAGILINGDHVNAARLKPGDQIGIGEVMLVFKN